MSRSFFISDGIDIAPLLSAHLQFEQALKVANSDLEKAGTIQYFEFTFELTWKTLRRILKTRGKDLNSPKTVLREAERAMSLQIEPRHLKIVLDILGPHAAHTAVFGSRAKGTERTLSDLDLVMRISIAPTDIAKLRAAFEESNLPLLSDFLELVEKDFVPLTAPTP